MIIYVASMYSQKEKAKAVRDILVKAGHQVTSRWLDRDTSPDAKEARIDLEDIDHSNTLVLLTLPKGTFFSSGGRMVELGYALAKRKFIFVLGPLENLFTELPEVIHCETTDELTGALVEMDKVRGISYGYGRGLSEQV